MRIPLHRDLALLSLAVLTVGCGPSRSSMRSSFSTSTGSAHLEAHDGGPVLVAYYENRELHGAEAFERIIANQNGGWLRNRSAIDHPNLPDWRHQLLRGQELAEEPGTTAREVITAVGDLPFHRAREDVFSIWMGTSAERAADLLDQVNRLGVGRSFVAAVLSRDLGGTADDQRTAKWMAQFAGKNQREAALVLARSPDCGLATARVALHRLAGFSNTHRRRIFAATAPRLAGRASDANLIVAAADQLSTKDEAPALLALLDRRDVDRELSVAILRALGDRPGASRPSLFSAAARSCVDDRAAAPVVARAFARLSTRQHLAAARTILESPTLAPELIDQLLDQAGSITSRDREAFFTALIQSRHFRAEHRAKCGHSARRRLTGRSRDRVGKLLGTDLPPRRSR